MIYYLDTDLCVSILRGNSSDAFSFFMIHNKEEVRLPSVVKAELLLGCEKIHNQNHTDKVKQFLQPFIIEAFDEKAAECYVKMRAFLEERGQIIGPNDLIVAATVQANQGILLTNNVREYKRIPDLPVMTFGDIGLQDIK